VSRDNAQLLINRIFDLPTEEHPTEAFHFVAQLPKPVTVCPREKPIPKAKQLTKWEQFAKLKGIQKKSKGRMVFDEEKQEYLPRFGYKRAFLIFF
jgi:regulator of ribosome biosynthesis